MLFIGAIVISATYYWSLLPSEREKYQVFEQTAPSTTKNATIDNDVEIDNEVIDNEVIDRGLADKVPLWENTASIYDETDTYSIQDASANNSTVNNTKLTRKEKKAKKREERREKKAKKREEKIRHQHDKN